MLRLLVSAILAVALLAGCGNDDSGDAVEGTGYTVDTPGGWDDRSDDSEEFAASGFEPDIVLTADPEGGFSSNINVLRQGSLADGVDADRLTEQSRQALQDPAVLEQLGGDLAPSDISDVSALDIDGEQARAFDYSSEREGQELRFRQVYTVREGSGYVLTYTALADGFEEGSAALDDVVESWSWD
ncbi:MAG: hypothetical protein WD844_04685 [Thermoleophilaceae bacterium]